MPSIAALSDPLQAVAGLGAALAAGLLVGLERGWQGRELPEGGRVAGLRTFALIGLLGGVLAIASPSPVPLALGLAGVALLFAVSFARASAASRSLSITSGVAAMVTYGLGAVAAGGHVILAVGAAAVVALLLDLKGELHEGMRHIQPAELNAVLQFGVLTAAILPLLPDQGYGPYDALNPFRLWLAVIVIAALSLAGHVAARWRGARQGLLWAGLLGGIASSTAATLALARSATYSWCGKSLTRPPRKEPRASASRKDRRWSASTRVRNSFASSTSPAARRSVRGRSTSSVEWSESGSTWINASVLAARRSLVPERGNSTTSARPSMAMTRPTPSSRLKRWVR